MSNQATVACLALLAAFAVGAMANDESRMVRAKSLQELLMFPEVSAPATVESLADARVSAEITAVVSEVSPRVGDTVESGGLLVELDCTDYGLRVDEMQARLEALEARRDFARKQLDRALALGQKRTLSQEVLEQREADAASLGAERTAAAARLAILQRELGKCRVLAPFDALVLERLVAEGEYAVAGTPMIRVLDIDRLEVTADIIDADADGLPAASQPAFRYRDVDYPVRLRALLPVMDSRSRTRQARLEFEAADNRPPTGAVGRLVWTLPAALPADYLVQRKGQLGAFVVEEGRARFRALPSAREGRPATVDLPTWTQVITDGRLSVVDGERVEVLD